MKTWDEGYLILATLIFILAGCSGRTETRSDIPARSRPGKIYVDTPYLQAYSIKYCLSPKQKLYKLSSVSCDRDGHIRILSDNGVLVPGNGSLFYPGSLTPDISYPPTVARRIKALTTFMDQTVYLDSQYVFSNAWAGKLQVEHRLSEASAFAAGAGFNFMISDGKQIIYENKKGDKIFSKPCKGLNNIVLRPARNTFLLVFPDRVGEIDTTGNITELYSGDSIRCACDYKDGKDVVIGTGSGYLLASDKRIRKQLPCTDITTIKEIGGRLWFGSVNGAFSLNDDGKFSYYAGERWLPGNEVRDIQPGPGNSILILTDSGLGQICFREMTLEEKALFYEKQVREKNIRYGFNCSSARLVNSYSSGQLAPQPSDNLWTSMYLASQLFRYKVTGSPEAKQNAFESFEALERLYSVTNIPGLFARSIERDHKLVNSKEEGWEEKELISGSPAEVWLPAHDHPNWAWRSTASSDQTVGQIFALTMVLELSDDTALKARALKCLDNLMGYIVKNDLYIIDVDGKPTLWGKWNPDYVNKFPENVGDRRLNSSNIIAFLQTAYKFTGKEIYKDKAMDLLNKHGYLANLTRPIAVIGRSESDNLSEVLSEAWNHSDDEMYFLAYWGLFPYAFSPELKTAYKGAIKDHWESERPEKNPLWNFTYAMTGADSFDLDESIWFLKNYPVDMRNWAVKNSDRKDIRLLKPNFRGQTTSELLPLGELPLYRHNGQIFTLDSKGDGKSLISAGDIWLLPYWMGRYLGIISPPSNQDKSGLLNAF